MVLRSPRHPGPYRRHPAHAEPGSGVNAQQPGDERFRIRNDEGETVTTGSGSESAGAVVAGYTLTPPDRGTGGVIYCWCYRPSDRRVALDTPKSKRIS